MMNDLNQHSSDDNSNIPKENLPVVTSKKDDKATRIALTVVVLIFFVLFIYFLIGIPGIDLGLR
jgi:hypothetical protein